MFQHIDFLNRGVGRDFPQTEGDVLLHVLAPNAGKRHGAEEIL